MKIKAGHMTDETVMFVGMGPNKGGSNDEPLSGKSGFMLAKLLRINMGRFLKFPRMNLNSKFNGMNGKGFRFDKAEGLIMASVCLKMNHPRHVLLGKEVAKCFGFKDVEFLETREREETSFLMLPHPSGIVLWWNDNANVIKASNALRKFVYGK